MKKFMILIGSLAFVGCGVEMSESVYDESVGFNGGFETVRDSLPVNWTTYTPSTTKDGDFDIVYDTEDKKEGQQSLRFDVRACSDVGGWFSPGLTKEVETTTDKTYRLSMWIKNDGARVKVTGGGVSSMGGEPNTIKDDDDSGEWTYLESMYTAVSEFPKFRFEVSILSPGTVHVDDVHFQEVK